MKKNSLFVIISLIFLTASCGKDTVKYVAAPNTQNLDTKNATSEYLKSKFLKEHGQLQIKINDTQTTKTSYSLKNKPWSSWWYPSQDRYFTKKFEKDSLLEKYDSFAKIFYSKETKAQSSELKIIKNQTHESWSGLCHAWAIASVLHPEPKRTKSFKGVKFSIGEQKALLLKSYENVQNMEIYGQRYDGDIGDIFEDINPATFHHIVEHFLNKKKKAFLMDYDPSYPVWTVPVFQADITIDKINDSTLEVSTWLTYASSFVSDKNFTGTKRLSKLYKYNLIGSFDMTTNIFSIEDGRWREESSHDHPDYMIAFPENVERKSFNQDLHNKYIDKILGYR